jgi:hypothetical protein
VWPRTDLPLGGEAVLLRHYPVFPDGTLSVTGYGREPD